MIGVRRAYVDYAEHFNASTSGIGFGQPRSQVGVEHSVLACVYPRGAGESGTNGSIWSMVPSASISNGPILSQDVNGGTPIIQVRIGSSGTANFPARNSANNGLVYNAWNYIAFSYDGGLTASTSIRIYSAVGSTNMAEVAYGGAANGTGTPNTGAGNDMWIGDNSANSRSFNGDIAFVCHWVGRVLTLQEFQQALNDGPLNLWDGMALCWANGMDYGPYGISPVVRTDVGYRSAPNTQLGSLGPYYVGQIPFVKATAAITGTLAVTLGNATLAADAVVEQEGTLAVTLGDATLAAAAVFGSIDGDLAATLGDVTLAASGTAGSAVDGSLAVTLQDFTLAADGVVEQEGTLAVTLQDATLAATGYATAVGTLAVTLGATTLAATGTTTGPAPPSYNPLALTNPLTQGLTMPMTWR